MHSFLESRDICDYEIFIVEQTDKEPFNRGSLLNVGAVEAIRKGYTRLCFHDVDLIPMDVDYTVEAEDWPVELVRKVKNSVEPIAYNYFGGAALISSKAFIDVNGYSNKYRGWGYEDDDFLLRLSKKGYTMCSKGFQTALTSGKGEDFPGHLVTVPCTKPKKNTKVILVADFIPRFPSKDVGTRDMKVLSILDSTKGTECGISYDRYENYRFDIWDTGYKYHCITTEKMPPIHSRIVVELDLEQKELSMYHNGEYCGTDYLNMKRDFFFSPKEVQIGFSINGNTDFEGTILEAGMVYSPRKLTREQGIQLSLMQPENLNEFFGKGIKVFWYNAEGDVEVPYEEFVRIPVPCKAPGGLFNHLEHERADRTNEGNLPKEVKQNQDRFYRVSRGEIEENEGLSNIQDLYSTETSNYENKVTWIKVTRK